MKKKLTIQHSPPHFPEKIDKKCVFKYRAHLEFYTHPYKLLSAP